MSRVLIDWSPTIPPEVKKAASPILRRRLWLLPTWCQEFRVGFDPGGKFVEITVNFRNRWASLAIGPTWLRELPPSRENALVHELIHITLEPLSAGMERIIQDLTAPDTPLRPLADSMLSDGMEGAVEDFARAIERYQP